MNKNNLVYLRLLSYIKPYKIYFAIGLIGTIVTAATQPAIAAILKPLLDGAFVEQDPFYIKMMPLFLVLLFIIRGASSFIGTIAFSWLSTKVVLDFRKAMFEKSIRLPTSFYDKTPSGKLVSKFTNDVTQVTASATDVLVVIVRDSIQVIGLVAWVFYLNWKLSLLLLCLIPVVTTVVIIAGKRLKKLSHDLQNSFGNITHVLNESFKGHRELKIYGGENYEKSRFYEAANLLRRLQMKFRVTSSLTVPIVEIFGAVLMAIIIYISTQNIADNAMSVGEFMSFFAAIGLVLSPIKNLTKINDPLQRSLAAADSVFAIIDEIPEKDIAKSDNNLKNTEIVFDRVCFSYEGKNGSALNNVSFTALPNTVNAFVGSSGSGKSTLASMIPRLYDVTSGEIFLDGQNINHISLTELRKNISFVGQNVVLFNASVLENITYGEPNNSTNLEKANIALKNSYADNFVSQLPNGIDTIIGENGNSLSGGQRQRLAIARAFYKDAPILILDEATSALDSESENYIKLSLNKLMQNRTSIVIAHRLSTIEHADKIFVMDNGGIVEEGSHEELIELNGKYKRLHSSQFKD